MKSPENNSFRAALEQYYQESSSDTSWSAWNAEHPTRAEKSAQKANIWVQITASSFAMILLMGAITSLIIDLS